MNIAYRCAKCGSTNIVVKVWYNLEIGQVSSRDWESEVCWCKECKKYTTYGWFDLDEIVPKIKEEGE